MTTKTMTDRETQRREALASANAARSRVADYKHAVKHGEIPLTEAIEDCDLPITVGHLLTSVRWVGIVKAQAISTRARVNLDHVRMGGPRLAGRRPIVEAERERLLVATREVLGSRAA